MRRFLKKPIAVILTITMLMVMTSPAGVLAANKSDAVIDAAKQAGLNVESKEEIDAYSDALKEAGVDIASVNDFGNDKNVKVVTPEGGANPAVDAVPAEKPKTIQNEKAQSKRGATIKGLSDFWDLTDDIKNNCEDIQVGENVDNRYVTQELDETVTYKFTAPKSGDVVFWSTGSTDTCGRVLNSEGTELKKDDDSGLERNFSIIFAVTAGETYYVQANNYDGSVDREINVHLMYDEYSASINVSFDKKTGKATVSGTAIGETFEGLYVDGNKTSNNISGKASFSGSVINMKNYSVGYHTISAKLTRHETYVTYRNAVPTYIYGKPTVKASNFTTGKNYFSFYNGSSYSKDSGCKVFVDFKKKGGKWSNNYGPVNYGSSGKKGKLKANTWYYVRGHFGKTVKYNGKTYLFTGKNVGQMSGAVKIKTGKAKKPAVKSVKITKAKQFKRNYSYTTWIYSYGYGYPIHHTYTQWYTSFKVTVTLKKKPGTAGIYIGTKRLKGNKKKYTAKFTVTGKQIGKKLKVAVYSYQNATYKGYSPTCYKKAKVRR